MKIIYGSLIVFFTLVTAVILNQQTKVVAAVASSTALASCELSLDQWQRHVIDPNRPGRAVFIFAEDMDGDNKLDLVTGKYWYENSGPGVGGSWTRRAIGNSFEDTLAVYDFDNDGDLDLLGVSGVDFWVPFVWARNNGAGSFTVLNNIQGLAMEDNDPIQGVAIARFNPGGPLEIALSWDDTENPQRNDAGTQMLTVPANPSVQTWTRRQISTFAQGEELAAADLDEDGDIDLFLGTNWLRNEYPSSNWTRITIHPGLNGQASRIRLVDLDLDGDLDAIVGYSHDPGEQKVVWFEQKQSPTAQWEDHLITRTTTNGGYAESMDIADMDGDGDIDISLGEYRNNNNEQGPAKSWIVENVDGRGGNWRMHLVQNSDSNYQSNNPVDLDGDGDLDIIAKGWLHHRVHIYENLSDTGCLTPTPTPTNGPSPTPSRIPTPTNTPTPSPTPTAADGLIYISSSANGTVRGLSFNKEDILAYDVALDSWSLHFDGSDVGLVGSNLDAFQLQADNSILFSLAAPDTIPNLGSMDDADIIRFIPTSLGSVTTGSFEWYFDGSDVELTTSAENIDAIAFAPDGRLVISTVGNHTAGGVTGQDKDLLAFSPMQLGQTTSGTWAMYFDGSDVGLTKASEDIGGVWIDPGDGRLFLSTYGAFSIPGASGNKNDIFVCTPLSLGANTNCTFGPGLYWRGLNHGFTKQIDGIEIVVASD